MSGIGRASLVGLAVLGVAGLLLLLAGALRARTQGTGSLGAALYIQSRGGTWREGERHPLAAGRWEVRQSVLPGVSPGEGPPFQRIGITLHGGFSGDVYVDRVQIGARTYDFESGTTEGWQGGAGVTLTPDAPVAAHGAGALRVSLSLAALDNRGAQLWVPAGPEDVPGTAVTVRLYVESARSVRARGAFVARSGPTFTLDGAPFRFVGANMYNAAGDPAVYQCGPWMAGPDAELADWFRRARDEAGARVVRFWAYQRYTAGGADWRGLDRVFRLARAYDLKVIPVLENQWADCTAGGYKPASWYAGGYLQPYGGYSLSYKEHVRRVVERYRDEPAVLAWMLVNEAESKTAAGEPEPEALYAFARDMSAYVRGLDRNHLVTLGVMGGGQPGLAGALYERLHALPAVDLLEYHDYGAHDLPLPGAPATVVAPLSTAVYAQDSRWTWLEEPYVQNQSRTWQELRATLPAAPPAGAGPPFRRIGINLHGSFVGDVYVDRVQIGARTYDFESGTAEGWSTTGAVAAAVVSGRAVSGTRALRLGFATPPDGVQLWLPAGPEVVPGAPVTVRLYVDGPGQVSPPNTLAAALLVGQRLGKPVLVGESGMPTCAAADGAPAESLDGRAGKLNAKLEAFFRNGGAGYLIWAWEPLANCSYSFSSGDPLNAVLSEQARRLRGD